MRYMISMGSNSGHCCFEATVVYTSRIQRMGRDGCDPTYDTVCECFSEDDAIMICDALNATVKT